MSGAAHADQIVERRRLGAKRQDQTVTTFTPNPKQKQAIEHAHGPMLVLAGAGTGKTTVLVERIAWLIEQGHAKRDEILAITFTDNAADELKARVEKRLRRKTAIFAGTFHA
ncbi:MAG TPA: UvrD-helicase domain-containing protein, partial [Candidatus Angelobacter sp.]|nr:UvrD-helicase domain-containing protein [Candidatus Angelobacter sp.]